MKLMSKGWLPLSKDIPKNRKSLKHYAMGVQKCPKLATAKTILPKA